MTTAHEMFLGSDSIPIGYRDGDLVRVLRISGRDSTGALPNSLEEQLALAYENLLRAVRAAGGGPENVAQVSFYLADFAARAAINEGWVATFPDAEDRPTYKFMAASLPAGELVQLTFNAVLGGRRQLIALPGVAHANPIPLALRVGDYLFTSRLLPYDQAIGKPPATTVEQVEHLFLNAEAVLAAGGMTFAEVTEGRGFLAEAADRPLLVEPFVARTGGAAPLQVSDYRVGELKVMLELVAKTTRRTS